MSSVRVWIEAHTHIHTMAWGKPRVSRRRRQRAGDLKSKRRGSTEA